MHSNAAAKSRQLRLRIPGNSVLDVELALAVASQDDRQPSLLQYGGIGRCAGNKRREMYNSGKTSGAAWSYQSDNCERGDSQGDGQVDYWPLKAGMAVRACVEIPRGLVVMDQASEGSENENHNNGESLDWQLFPGAPFWKGESKSHLVAQCEGLTCDDDVHKLAVNQFSPTEPSLISTIL